MTVTSVAPGAAPREVSEQRIRPLRATSRLEGLLNTPVDIASLAMFRFLFGALMAIAMARFLAKGWVREFYLEPTFFFTYAGFSWVRPFPAPWMYGLVTMVGVAALGVATGCFYRVSATIFFLGFTYLELIDKTTYLNHYYLVSLLGGLLIFLPAHRAFSFDAWRRPLLRRDWIPSGFVNLLRFQVAVVYIFAGLAKVNADWLLRAQPLRIWLRAQSDLPLIGPWLSEEWVAFAASWAGATFDLTVVFFLLRRQTRGAAYCVLVIFHLATALLFRIGMFPWIMMASALLFFPPDFPRRWIGQRKAAAPSGVVPFGKAWSIVAAFYCTVQLALPLRSLLQRGNSAWDYEGFNFAWRVMLVEKRGSVDFIARDSLTGKEWRVSPLAYLTPRQEMFMAQDPAMIQAFARHLARCLQDESRPRIEIRTNAFATLNGRPSQRLIDPNADLATASLAGCVLPLK